MTLLDRDRLYGYDRYRRGNWWVTDDRDESRVRFLDTRVEWTGAVVSAESWEARNAQDFIQGVPDIQSVPDPRPPPPPGFLGPDQSNITVSTPAGSVLVIIGSTFGMVAGNRVGVPVADLSIFQTTIATIINGTSLTLNGRLPMASLVGGTVVDYSAIEAPNLG